MKIEQKKLSTVSAVVLAVIFILESIIFIVFMRMSGVLKAVDSGAEDTLVKQAEKSRIFIETEMLKKWSSIDGTVEKAGICMEGLLEEKNADIADIFSDSGLKDAYIDNMSAELLTMLRTNSVNGGFIVLCNSAEAPSPEEYSEYTGVFFKDSDPLSNPADYSDIVLDRGCSDISSKYKIPLDMKWSSSFVYSQKTEGKMDFFFVPVIAAHNNISSASNCGYWCSVTSPSNDSKYYGETHLCYSVPLIYDGQVYGVMGVSVAKDRILSIFPEEAVANDGNGGFALVTCSKTDGSGIKAEVQAAFGAAVEKNISEGTVINLKKYGSDNSLYTIKSIPVAGEQAYCAVDNIGMYTAESPFSSTKWAVLAIISEDGLFGVSESISNRMTAALVCAMLLGICAAVALSKLLSAPIGRLCSDAEAVTESEAAPERSYPVKELSELSSALHRFTAERNRAVIDLKAERERYLIALQTTRNFLFEYDCREDIFTIYHFNRSDTQFENGRHHSYRNFRSLIIEGKVCPDEDIPEMLKFLDGEIFNDIRMRIRRKNGDVSWCLVRSKPIYDSDGKLARVVASSSDISEEVAEEQKRRDAERRDKISGFYKSDYGEMLAEKAVLEADSPYCIAVISMTAADLYIGSFGAYSYDAVIEELGTAIRHYSQGGDIIWRMNYSEFAIYIPKYSDENIHSDFETLLSYIGSFYSAEDSRIACHVGISQNAAHTPLKDAVLNAVRAECAAVMPHYPNIVYYYDTLSDVEAGAAFMKHRSEQRNAYVEELNSGFAVTDSVVSYAINMLEKMKQLEAAMRLIFCKAGHILKLRKIAWFEINHDYLTLRAEVRWSDFGAEPVSEDSLHLEKTELGILTDLFRGKDFAKADKDFYVSSNPIMELVTAFRGSGETCLFPVFDKELLTGFMAFAADENGPGEADRAVAEEIAKIVGAYILKSRTSIESRAKSDFLSRMSHEIRTPMNAIMGMTAIALDEKDLAPSTRDCLEKIDVSSKYLLSLINDILDMSRIESGKMTVETVCFSLEDTIAKIDAIMRTPVEAKGIYLKIDKNITKPNVMGDPLKLNQVIVNIIGNALKFTSKGGITVTVKEEATAMSELVSVKFSVRDTGIGISEENLGRIFNSFEQAEAATARRYGGTGLGLSISSNLVKMMGGTLEVKSKVGEGSEFYFTLPYHLASDKDIPVDSGIAADVDFSSKRILLAEDDELNTEIAVTLLKKEKLNVDTAENGKIAADKFISSPEGYYDAILMDIRMPVMDGAEATKLIRQADRRDAKTVPIIAMSANAFDEDMKKSIDCGMNGHLSKPIDMNKVRALLRKIWS
ncbi:MAG: ATP-binding protein [Oscillospiraceae bacterium]